MPMHNVLRSTAFRWALGIAAWSALLSLALFAFVYWQTAAFLQEELAETLRHEVRSAAREPTHAASHVEDWISEDLHSTHFGGVFGPDGRPRAGNLAAIPKGMVLDGDAYRAVAMVTIAARSLEEAMWSAGLTLPDGTVVVAHDTDEIDRVQTTTLRALGLGLVPTLALSIFGGALLAGRARRRLAVTEAAVAQVMLGDLRKRLPVGRAGDELDRLAGSVNRMLDEIERLMEEVRGIGDAVAHDLRTPLTRLRARLERSREEARSVEELQDAIDQGLAWIDQTLTMVTAVLRIGEIEHGRRIAAFAPVDLATLVREAAELFEPLAQDENLALTVSAQGRPMIEGDRDLLFEATSNLLDNAIKFTPAGGRVEIGVEHFGDGVRLFVEDTGPGIVPAERAQVFRRFYRSERARREPGNGLGLGLVAAIAKLHGYEVAVVDASGGGSRFEITVPRSGHRSTT